MPLSIAVGDFVRFKRRDGYELPAGAEENANAAMIVDSISEVAGSTTMVTISREAGRSVIGTFPYEMLYEVDPPISVAPPEGANLVAPPPPEDLKTFLIRVMILKVPNQVRR